MLRFLFVIFFAGCAHVPTWYGGEESVIVIHGFGRSAGSMSRLAEAVHEAGYEVRNVGYSSIQQSIEKIKSDVFDKFDQYILKNPSKKIHFVGHSLGGLLIRAYLDQTQPKNLGSVILMGTPNQGTALVEEYQDKWYFSWLGPVLPELRAAGSQFLETLKAPYYKVGVIAGSRPYSDSSEKVLKGVHDGLVPVESAQLEGMSDFILIDVNHSRMKRDSRVITQVIHFLKYTRFKK